MERVDISFFSALSAAAMKRLTTISTEDFALEYVFGIGVFRLFLVFLTDSRTELLYLTVVILLLFLAINIYNFLSTFFLHRLDITFLFLH